MSKKRNMMLDKTNKLLDAANSILLGKEEELKVALTSVLAGGHLLIEDVPGVGKTTLVYLLGQLMGLEISRIQFTNDLLPGDILGTSVYKKATSEFEFKKGPIFGQLILADELNRATPKTQSALLQVMEERKISVEGQEFTLEFPFIIVATQNPFFQVGTFPLPESQLDRFFMSLHLDFPDRQAEKSILLQPESREMIIDMEPIFTLEDLALIRREIEKIKVSDAILEYALDLLERGRGDFSEGVYLSPRAGKDLLKAARSFAFIHGRDFILPEDIQMVAPHVLGHRVGGGKGVEHGQNLIKELITKVPLDG